MENNDIKRILFVCLGNICRSCTAEEIMRTLLRREGLDKMIEVDSAGLISYHQGEEADPRMRAHAARRGYYITHLSRPGRMTDFEEFDLIIGMDDSNMRNMHRMLGGDPDGKIHALLDYAGRAGESIADPWYTGNFDETYADVLEGCQGLLEQLKKQSGR